MKGAFKLGFVLMGAGGGVEGTNDLVESVGYGMGQNPELLMEFTRRFKKIVEPHKFIYGLACSNCIPDLDNLYPREKIVDNLGHCYDEENGIYCEGTWQNGELAYGIIYLRSMNILDTCMPFFPLFPNFLLPNESALIIIVRAKVT